MTRGLVTKDGGTAVKADAPYRHGQTIYYFREVRSEPESPVSETILFQDAQILVVDKPHGMRVTPAGDHVDRSLLSRLQRSVGNPNLAPLHRLDQETAGLILFSVNPNTRGRYHALFANRAINRTYVAVTRSREIPSQKHWIVENRIERGEPWFRQRIVQGLPNAITRIEWRRTLGDLALFHLYPKTGRKHQLRVHMASIGFPILGDPLYPQQREPEPSDPPLQLLAYELRFIDPVTGVERAFKTSLKLASFEGPY